MKKIGYCLMIFALCAMVHAMDKCNCVKDTVLGFLNVQSNPLTQNTLTKLRKELRKCCYDIRIEKAISKSGRFRFSTVLQSNL